jgi:hypothetical protein
VIHPRVPEYMYGVKSSGSGTVLHGCMVMVSLMVLSLRGLCSALVVTTA